MRSPRDASSAEIGVLQESPRPTPQWGFLWKAQGRRVAKQGGCLVGPFSQGTTFDDWVRKKERQNLLKKNLLRYLISYMFFFLENSCWAMYILSQGTYRINHNFIENLWKPRQKILN
jgi:hypothetical protein